MSISKKYIIIICIINHIIRISYVSRKRQQTGLHFRSIRIFRSKTPHWAKKFLAGNISSRDTLPALPVESLRKYYHDKNGRPSKEMYSMLGLMILQQMHDLANEKAVADFMFDTRWRCALDVPGDSDREAYVRLRSLWSIRKHLTEDGLYVEMFE